MCQTSVKQVLLKEQKEIFSGHKTAKFRLQFSGQQITARPSASKVSVAAVGRGCRTHWTETLQLLLHVSKWFQLKFKSNSRAHLIASSLDFFKFFTFFRKLSILYNAVFTKTPFWDATTTDCQVNSSLQRNLWCRAPTQIPFYLSLADKKTSKNMTITCVIAHWLEGLRVGTVSFAGKHL